MHLGYFGGSFDPPHLGHLAVARAAADRFALDRVLLVPTAKQPLKPQGSVAGYADRLAMVRLLCQADPRLAASDLEAPTDPPAPNYTVDTLRHLLAAEPHAALSVIVGADAFHEIPRWRSPDDLLRLAEWIVVTRPGADGASAMPLLPPLTAPQRARVHLLTGFEHPASATAVRAQLASRADCANLLPPTILAYIAQHALYAPAPK